MSAMCEVHTIRCWSPTIYVRKWFGDRLMRKDSAKGFDHDPPTEKREAEVEKYKRMPLKFKVSKLNAEKYGIHRFISFVSDEIGSESVVLDAGAGKKPYAHYFNKFNYISLDLKREKTSGVNLDIYGDLHNIPIKSESIDVVICIQVLQYIQDPTRVLQDFFRILKPKGKLFLSAPQECEDFAGTVPALFGFSKHGLEYLFKKAGFEIVFIEPIGGYFWYIGKRPRRLGYGCVNFNKVIGLPFYVLFTLVVPAICFYLDLISRRNEVVWNCGKVYTLGYACYVTKPKRRYSK